MADESHGQRGGERQQGVVRAGWGQGPTCGGRRGRHLLVSPRTGRAYLDLVPRGLSPWRPLLVGRDAQGRGNPAAGNLAPPSQPRNAQFRAMATLRAKRAGRRLRTARGAPRIPASPRRAGAPGGGGAGCGTRIASPRPRARRPRRAETRGARCARGPAAGGPQSEGGLVSPFLSPRTGPFSLCAPP